MKPQRAMTPPKSCLQRAAARSHHCVGACVAGEGAGRWLLSEALARHRGRIDESAEVDQGHRIATAGWIGRCTLLSAGGGKT